MSIFSVSRIPRVNSWVSIYTERKRALPVMIRVEWFRRALTTGLANSNGRCYSGKNGAADHGKKQICKARRAKMLEMLTGRACRVTTVRRPGLPNSGQIRSDLRRQMLRDCLIPTKRMKNFCGQTADITHQPFRPISTAGPGMYIFERPSLINTNSPSQDHHIFQDILAR